MPESPIITFDRIVQVEPPRSARVLFNRVGVLGGSVAGLLAARVLADHAREVVVIERDDISVGGLSRAGVPQDRQGHGLLPGGLAQLERWLPGFTDEAQKLGGVLAGPGQQAVYFDGQQKVPGSDAAILMATRPFLESLIRDRVLALPNVFALRAQVAGLGCRDDAVRTIRYTAGGASGEVDVDFAVDAMGRASKFSDWVEALGYERPPLERVKTGISYATALFDRAAKPADLDLTCALAQLSPSSDPGGPAVGAVNAVEHHQWLVMLMTYGENLPGSSIEAFRAACAKHMPPFFDRASGSAVTREIVTYHQGDSRRRHFAGLTRFPALAVSVGDAVASFNPVYGQGITMAALHAACLSRYLTGEPDLGTAAWRFFEWQQVVVDAAWTMSAGADAARRDAIEGREVPADVRQQRWGMEQLLRASVYDATISAAFDSVAFMMRHPFTLGDPALIERAIAVNQRLSPSPATFLSEQPDG